MRKSKLLQELANGFPEWTKVRKDDQSIGKSLLNAYALGAEDLFTELDRNLKNLFLTTANSIEIDQLEIFSIPQSFPFQKINENTLAEEKLIGTVSGLLNTWVPVENIVTGSVKDFWYDALPTRITLDETFASNNIIASGLASSVDLTLNFTAIQSPNVLSIKVDSAKLVHINNDNVLIKPKIRVSGLTWKDTVETEDVVFLYSETKNTFKVWKEINSISCIDFPEEANILVSLFNFNQELYNDSFTELSQFTYKRENFPIFWKLIQDEFGKSILTANTYVATRAVELLKHQPQFEEIQSWNLLDENNNALELVDIAPVPFQQKLLGLVSSGIYVFDTYFDYPDLKIMTEKTSNNLIDIETTSDYIIQNEEIEVLCLFQKPIKTIVKHRLKIKYPDGQEFGILEDGTLVSTSSNFWVADERTERFIRQPFVIELQDFGSHVITLEAIYLDGSTQITQRVVTVVKKNALKYIDFSDITNTAEGISFNHLNQVLIKDGGNIYRLNLHYDYCLWDIENLELILREKYNSIKIFP